MKVSKVIEELTKVLKSEGDIDVRVWADHSQCYMKVNSVEVMYANEEEWTIESSYDSVEEFHQEREEDPLYQFVSLWAG